MCYAIAMRCLVPALTATRGAASMEDARTGRGSRKKTRGAHLASDFSTRDHEAY
jgi:hypothetical protein